MAVVFSARLLQDIPLLGKGEAITFQADVNKGGGYDDATGIFKAPYHGLYKFTFTVGRSGVGKPIAVFLEMNAKQAAGAVTGVPNTYDQWQYSQAENQAIIEMEQGDKASVVIHQEDAEGLAGNSISTFSGLLVERKQ